MKFKTDENLAEETAELIREFGHDCETVHDEGLRGASDEQIAAVCVSEGRALVTLDLDFADIRAYPPALHSGITVLRPGLQSPASIHRVLLPALRLLETEQIHQRLWVCDEAGVRIRGE